MIGTIVEDRYLVEAELGNGAMGRVFAARHVKVGRRVAIKIMHDELAQNAAIVERFAREAMVAARLRHPNLVSVLDVGQTAERRPLLVLELAPGVPLSHLAVEPLSGPRVVNLVRQLLRGLAHAHAAGLIHRDLKPDNILVETTNDGLEIPRIVDFGIAVTADRDDSTIAGRRLTDANMVIGTPFYMSPEQARAKDIDHRSDLFSLGVIMYELLAGMPPFPGTSIDVALANASKDPPSIADRAGIEVDALLEAFTRKLMARRLEQRFQSAREALDVLALIELDRMAAARVLGGSPLVEMPRPIFAEGSGPNVLPVAAAAQTPVEVHVEEPREAPALALPLVRANSDAMTTITEAAASDDEDLEYDPAKVTRRRARFALGFIAAALVTVVALFVARQPNGHALASNASAPMQPSPVVATAPAIATAPITTAPIATNAPAIATNAPAIATNAPAIATTAPAIATNAPAIATTAAAPSVTTAPSATTATISTSHKAKAAMSARAAQSHVATPTSKITTTPVSTTYIFDAAPETAAPKPVVSPDSVDAVVAKYQAVAKRLKAQPNTPATDDLWMRFRLIRINEAIATQQSRHQAIALLAAIDHAIR